MPGRGFPNLKGHDVAFGKIYIRLGKGSGELEKLHQDFKRKEAPMLGSISEKPWKLKDFTVQGSASGQVFDRRQTNEERQTTTESV